MSRGGFDDLRRNACHAPVIRRAATQKTRAAVWSFLDDAATRRDGGGAEWVRWTEDSHYGEAHGGGDVHRAGVIANEEMALRKKRG
jgi:hypothetical protein